MWSMHSRSASTANMVHALLEFDVTRERQLIRWLPVWRGGLLGSSVDGIAVTGPDPQVGSPTPTPVAPLGVEAAAALRGGRGNRDRELDFEALLMRIHPASSRVAETSWQRS